MNSLWTNRRYVSWLVSDTAKGIAGGFFTFAVPLLALMITDDPAQAGIIGAVGGGIRVALMLFGGVLADRHRRITLMVLGGLLGVVISAAFTALTLGGALTFASLLLIDALLAARSGLLDIAGESALKDIVSAETMGRAQAANRARDAALELAGGPIGGAALGVGGWLIGVIMTVGHAVSAVTAWLIPRLPGAPGVEATDAAASDAPESDSPAAKPQVFREIGDGVRWLFARPDLRTVLFVTTIINLGINTTITTVIYAMQQEGRSPAVIGLVGSAIGAAMLVGALGAGWIVSRIGAGAITLAAITALALGAAGLALVQHPLAIALVFAVPALLLAPVNAALGGYAMVATPTALMGRVGSASGVFGMGAIPLAPLIAGFGLAQFGRTTTVLLGAGICLVAAALALSSRSVRSLPAEAGWSAHARRFDRVPA